MKQRHRLEAIREVAMLALSYGPGNAIEKKEAALRSIYALADPPTDASVDAFLQEVGSGNEASTAKRAASPRRSEAK